MTRLGRQLRHGWCTDSLTGSCPASLELTARDFKANKKNRLYMVSSLAQPGTSWLKTEIAVSILTTSLCQSACSRLQRFKASTLQLQLSSLLQVCLALRD